jgi:hypothetical protein
MNTCAAIPVVTRNVKNSVCCISMFRLPENRFCGFTGLKFAFADFRKADLH